MKVQGKWGSVVEVALNLGSGFFISWGAWIWVIAPLFGIENDMQQGFLITCAFTVISLLRNYVWRRLFNWWSERKLNG